jgi:hypothetical protein
MSHAIHGLRRAAGVIQLSAGLYKELAVSAAQLLPRRR